MLFQKMIQTRFLNRLLQIIAGITNLCRMIKGGRRCEHRVYRSPVDILHCELVRACKNLLKLVKKQKKMRKRSLATYEQFETKCLFEKKELRESQLEKLKLDNLAD